MEITIKGNSYRASRLDAMKQFHVARRLGPAIWMLLVSSLGAMRDVAKEGGATQLKDVVAKLGDESFKTVAMSSIGPLTQILANMPDADAEYVIKTCLSVVMRNMSGDGGQGWAKVQTPEGAMMYADIEMPEMLQLVFAVLRENLQNFTSALPLRG